MVVISDPKLHFLVKKHTLSRDDNFFHSSDLAHIHRAKSAHTRHALHQI